MKGREFALGDLHGGYKGLKQVLDKVGFNYEIDTLYSLGDIVDGWSESFECVEELLKIKNLVAIRGNHDDVFSQYLTHGKHHFGWLHGGHTTLESYAKHAERDITIRPRMGGYFTDLTYIDIPKTHLDFFKNQVNYFIKGTNVFVHGGFNRHEPIEEQTGDIIYYWDRDLFKAAFADSLAVNKPALKLKDEWIQKIFIGHTPTINYGTTDPILLDKVINLDTGGGYGEGRITIIDINTLEVTQSDLMKDLYPKEAGR